jgi:hypothetical protein
MPDEKSILDSILATPDAESAPEVEEAIIQKAEAPEDDRNRVSEAEDDPNEDVEAEDDDNLEDEEGSEEHEELDFEDDEEDGDDDLVAQTHDVVVNGKTERVSLEELKASYSGTKFIDQRIGEATRAKQQAEAIQQEAYELRQQYSAGLEQLSQIIKSAALQEPDWAKLRAENPEQYNHQRAAWDDMKRKQEAVAAEQKRESEALQRQQQDAMSVHLQDEQHKLLTAIPSLSDPNKAEKIGKDWADTAREFGYTDEELAAVVDHRAFLILNALTEARKVQEQRKAPARRRRKVKTSVRPNSNTAHTRRDEQKRRQDAVAKRARQTGKPEDVAATLLV